MKIDKDALPFIAGIALAALLAAWLVHPLAMLPLLLLLLFVVWFFRDPERETPGGEGRVVSPADGRIIKAGPEGISIFLNIFNVHIGRAPIAGRVESVEHTPGRFLAAYRDEAAEHNERTAIRMRGPSGSLTFTLVAGLVARRIVCRVASGDRLVAGQRIGLIRFGSRVDIRLPEGAEIAVALRQKVVAGETVIARLPAAASDA